jgi:glycosyltransferase involved in cell wall biosynthesis
MIEHRKINLQIHATNINGFGARNLLLKVTSEIIKNRLLDKKRIYLNQDLNQDLFRKFENPVFIKRILWNPISRAIEIFNPFLYGSLDSSDWLLVFGDIPLFWHKKQILFLQSILMIDGSNIHNFYSRIKFIFVRKIFSFTISRPRIIFVQSELMKNLLASLYPETRDRIFVCHLPSPYCDSINRGRNSPPPLKNYKKKLTLFYPARPYAHKNFKILANLSQDLPVENIFLTVDNFFNPNVKLPFLNCIGPLDENEVLNYYDACDGLIFLSLTESYGFPLVEAMSLGKPIICPDLPYARYLCGENAIYFSISSSSSLEFAILTLHRKLLMGWEPDWSYAMLKIPRNWKKVCDFIVKTVVNSINDK